MTIPCQAPQGEGVTTMSLLLSTAAIDTPLEVRALSMRERYSLIPYKYLETEGTKWLDNLKLG